MIPLLPHLAAGPATDIATPVPAAPAGTGAAPGFGERLAAALDDLAAAQDRAAGSARAWELGQTQDLAAVMIDQQVSSLGFELTMTMRNKVLGAYRDIMNMPV
ncbi:flagellar hook-basal body complex protein FliE [Frigidibacter oleivorans]|uniref:flagellar hook-basal body complex protein FliE n=1 Tax=Frigidibacter oleivorans TaxID=2487129 RepID=UPI000F8F82AD|nr:flagellar hook-basal body complex protein FliE [Frigidibacter oleivorans]